MGEEGGGVTQAAANSAAPHIGRRHALFLFGPRAGNPCGRIRVVQPALGARRVAGRSRPALRRRRACAGEPRRLLRAAVGDCRPRRALRGACGRSAPPCAADADADRDLRVSARGCAARLATAARAAPSAAARRIDCRRRVGRGRCGVVGDPPRPPGCRLLHRAALPVRVARRVSRRWVARRSCRCSCARLLCSHAAGVRRYRLPQPVLPVARRVHDPRHRPAGAHGPRDARCRGPRRRAAPSIPLVRQACPGGPRMDRVRTASAASAASSLRRSRRRSGCASSSAIRSSWRSDSAMSRACSAAIWAACDRPTGCPPRMVCSRT